MLQVWISSASHKPAPCQRLMLVKLFTKWKISCVRLLASSSYPFGKQLGKPYITCEPIWTSYTYQMEGFPYNRCSEIVVTAFTITPKPFKVQKNQEPTILRIQSVSNLVLKLLFSDCFSMTLGSQFLIQDSTLHLKHDQNK